MVSELPDERKGQIKDAVEAFSERVNELSDERKGQIEAVLENFNKLMNAASENKTNGITESPESLLQVLAEEAKKAKKAQEDTNKE
jgi:ABC-type transporter Mla subunit MlaD